MNQCVAAAELLIADDSVATTAMLKMLLERAGYRVRVVHSGDQALAELERQLPDLVLCDVEMPGLNGLQVLEKARANPMMESLPFIMVTSRTSIEDRIRGLDCGATDYVTKPFKIEELKARIRSHLRFKALQDEILAKNRELARTQRLLEEKMIALHSAYQKIFDHQERTKRALDLASKVQRGLLPGSSPAVPGYAVASVFRPAEEVAGDFYDFIDLGSRLGVAIGDVAGKGVAASLVMVLIRTILRSVALSGVCPQQVLARVNQLIIKDYGSQDSTTLFYGILDPGDGSFTFSNGGHEFPVLVSGDGRSSLELSVGGPFLGIFPKARYNQAEVRLRSQDRITLFTDGLYHLSWASEKLMNSERLIHLLRARAHSSLDDVMRELGYNVSHPSSGSPRADDITVVQLSCSKTTKSPSLGSLEVFCDVTSLREVQSMVSGLGCRAGLSTGSAEDLSRAVCEVVSCASQPEDCATNENRIRVSIELEEETQRVRVQVSNDAGGFPEPSIQNPLSQDQGFGLAKRLTDVCRGVTSGGKTVMIVLEKAI